MQIMLNENYTKHSRMKCAHEKLLNNFSDDLRKTLLESIYECQDILNKPSHVK